MSYDARLAELDITLPEPAAPGGLYSPVVQVGNMLYLSGHVPSARGKVGSAVSEAEGVEAAAEVARLMLASVRKHLGTLDRVERVVKVFGLVNCTTDFTNIPQVINGFSQVMIDVFGENGRAARSAVGAGSLPLGVPVEVEAIFQLKE